MRPTKSCSLRISPKHKSLLSHSHMDRVLFLLPVYGSTSPSHMQLRQPCAIEPCWSGGVCRRTDQSFLWCWSSHSQGMSAGPLGHRSCTDEDGNSCYSEDSIPHWISFCYAYNLIFFCPLLSLVWDREKSNFCEESREHMFWRLLLLFLFLQWFGKQPRIRCCLLGELKKFGSGHMLRMSSPNMSWLWLTETEGMWTLC